MIVIQDHGIAASDSPASLYKNPPSVYVASLFDDVNEIFVNGKRALLYPHQVKIDAASDLSATVRNSFYKGSHWLIELDFEGQLIFARHHEDLPQSESVSLRFG